MTSNPINNLDVDSQLIEAEAASWIAQLDSGEMTSADRIAMREWVRRSPRHREEIRRLASIWSHFDTILESGMPSKVIPSRSRRKNIDPFFKWSGIAVATLLFVAVLSPIYFFSQPSAQQENKIYSVEVGNNRAVSLADGSTMELDRGALAKVEFGTDARVVTLLSGQGYFKVAKDKSRPFQVVVGREIVQAVGTEFEVSIENGEASVLVREGKVEIISASPATGMGKKPDIGNRGPLLVAGQMATLSNEKLVIRKIAPQQLKNRLSWRTGMLVFEGDRLDQVIKDVGKYSDLSIVIADPELRGLKIGGAFKSGSIKPFLDTLEQTFEVRVEYADDQTVYLYQSVPSPEDPAGTNITFSSGGNRIEETQ